jgi:hypothetical protein
VLAVQRGRLLAVGVNLVARRARLPLELVDQLAGLNSVRRRDEADAAAVSEFLDVGELTDRSWVSWRLGYLADSIRVLSVL